LEDGGYLSVTADADGSGLKINWKSDGKPIWKISRKPAGTKRKLMDERRNQIERNGDTRQKPTETLGTMGDSDGWRVEN
jgi:hypothetical protein